MRIHKRFDDCLSRFGNEFYGIWTFNLLSPWMALGLFCAASGLFSSLLHQQQRTFLAATMGAAIPSAFLIGALLAFAGRSYVGLSCSKALLLGSLPVLMVAFTWALHCLAAMAPWISVLWMVTAALSAILLFLKAEKIRSDLRLERMRKLSSRPDGICSAIEAKHFALKYFFPEAEDLDLLEGLLVLASQSRGSEKGEDYFWIERISIWSGSWELVLVLLGVLVGALAVVLQGALTLADVLSFWDGAAGLSAWYLLSLLIVMSALILLYLCQMFFLSLTRSGRNRAVAKKALFDLRSVRYAKSI